MPRLGRGGCGFVPWAYLSYQAPPDTAFTITTGATRTMAWPHFYTNDRSAFGTTNFAQTNVDTAGDQLLVCKRAGVYTGEAFSTWPFTGASYYHTTRINWGVGVPPGWNDPDTPVTSVFQPGAPGFGGWASWDVSFQLSPYVNLQVGLSLTNNDAVSRAPTAVSMAVAYLGPSSAAAAVY